MRYALLIAILWSGGAWTQPRYGLSTDAYNVFVRWMATTCVGDEANQWAVTLQRYGAELAPAFRRALADGPSDDQLVRVRRAADARYAAIAALPPGEVRIEGITVRAVARPARKAYVDGEAERFAAGYRSNAIAGLAIVGGAEARATLRRIAGQPGNPLAPAASEGLKTLR